MKVEYYMIMVVDTEIKGGREEGGDEDKSAK